MRLFIAIDFNNEDFFRKIQDKLDISTAKLTLTKTYHLTLKFLGEVEDNKVAEIRERLSNIKFTSFKIIIENMGEFPNKNYVKVLWLGFKDEDKIIGLQEKVDDVLSDMFPKEKNFRSHITLARIRYIPDKEALNKNLKDIEIEKKEFEVVSFRLIKSTLTPKGPLYETMEEYPAK